MYKINSQNFKYIFSFRAVSLLIDKKKEEDKTLKQTGKCY